jgi:hypothetical protein
MMRLRSGNFRLPILFWTFYHYIRPNKNSFLRRLKWEQMGKNAAGANGNKDCDKIFDNADKAFLCPILFTSPAKSFMIKSDGKETNVFL